MADRPLGDVLKEIKAGADMVRVAGTELSRRIDTMEAWLNKLPGRVEASCHLYGTRPDMPEDRRLGLRKDGKAWKLSVYTSNDAFEDTFDDVALRDASMSDKQIAVRSFPKLLAAIAEAQKELVKSVADSIGEFDRVAKELNIKEGE